MALTKEALSEFLERLSNKPVEDVEKLFLHVISRSIDNSNEEAMTLLRELKRSDVKKNDQLEVKKEYDRLNKQQERLASIYYYLTHNTDMCYSEVE